MTTEPDGLPEAVAFRYTHLDYDEFSTKRRELSAADRHYVRETLLHSAAQLTARDAQWREVVEGLRAERDALQEIVSSQGADVLAARRLIEDDESFLVDADDYLHALDMLWKEHGGNNNYPLYRKFADFISQRTADAARKESP